MFLQDVEARIQMIQEETPCENKGRRPPSASQREILEETNHADTLILNVNLQDCLKKYIFVISSVQFSHSLVSDSLLPHGLQHTRPPCPSPTPRVYSNSCPLSCWCHPTISFSTGPFSTCLQSFPASGSFPMSQFFATGGQSIGVSASTSVLPMNIQDWFPLG